MEIVTHRKIVFADIFTAEFQKEVEKKLDEIAANISDARALENALRKLVITIDFKRDVEVNREEGLWVDTMKTIGVKLAPTRSNGCNVIVAKNDRTGKPEMIRQKFEQGELFNGNNVKTYTEETEEPLRYPDYLTSNDEAEMEETVDFYSEQQALAERGMDDDEEPVFDIPEEDQEITETFGNAMAESKRKLKVVK